VLPAWLRSRITLADGSGSGLLGRSFWLASPCRKQVGVHGPSGDADFFTLLAVVELIADKLPKTPPRTAPPGLIARIVFGGLCGTALAISAGGSLIIAAITGVIGALFGMFGGYNIRHALVVRAHLPDLAVALVEDVIAIAGGFLIVSRL
jgi:uncharacterized membrane protein